MAIKKARTTYFPLPDKRWLHRASLVTVIAFSTTLVVMSKTNNPAASNIRTKLTDIMTPILSVAASPMDAVNGAGVWIAEMIQLRAENVALKNEKIELLQWQAQAKTMQIENDSLRSLLNVVPTHNKTFITARIVSDLGGPYVHSALINGGSENGIKKDEAAISDSGLIGRVVDVGVSSARVLLLSDINSRVPVVIERTREKSILAGNNTDTPTLSYLTGDSKIKVGDRIITSGDGGVFPEGIPVGMITSIGADGVKVQPYVNATNAEFVSVIDYSF
jgi:rod shape-determining protein MreC